MPAIGTATTAGATAQEIEADVTSLEAEILANGNAEWRIVYRRTLADQNETQAFSDLQADIQANSSGYLDPFRQRMALLVANAENYTGRMMGVENASVTTRIENQPQDDFGIVTFSFDWAGFATVENDRILAGDAVDRLFLAQDERLQFTWPDSYERASSTPDPTVVEEQRVVWAGRIAFVTGEPRVELTPTAGSGGGPAQDDQPNQDEDGAPVILIVLLLAAIVAILVGVGYRRFGGSDSNSGTAGDSDMGTARAADSADAEGPPTDLLSSEERVLQLLEEQGGRMKQKEITEHFDWSSARTSQVVGELRDGEAIESFRIGRENVITLPDVDISTGDDTAAESDVSSENSDT